MIQVCKRQPPNFADIVAVFPRARGEHVIFSYAPFVYVPSGNELPMHLVKHEEIHVERQGKDPAGWWEKYLTDMQFRFDEELIAHRAEYKYLSDTLTGSRRREIALNTVSHRLASSLYGNMITIREAKLALVRA